MKIAVIPARGGSKRIPRKNIRPFSGRPMIEWSIRAALNSDVFDKVLVSTDDAEIAEVARAAGATIPFIRPAELAGDFTGTIPVVRHALEWFIEHYSMPDLLCCIYATAPFVTPDSLQMGLREIEATGSDYSFGVTSFPFPIQRAVRLNSAGRVEMFQPEHFNSRSQDLEEAYHDAGQFYWGRPSAWLKEKPIFSSNAVPIILPRYRVQDIDTEEDWLRAEVMFKLVQNLQNDVSESNSKP